MILTDKRTLVAKAETTPGTIISLASADFNTLVRNIKMSPEIEAYGRKYATGDHGHHPSVMGKQMAKIDFEFDLQYSGTPQTPAAWAKFFVGAGLVQTVNGTSGVRWMPDTLGDVASMSMSVQDIQTGASPSFLLYKFKGMMASSAKLEMNKLGEPIKCVMQYTGCFVSVADTSFGSLMVLTSPDTALPDAVLSATITAGGVAQRVSKFSMDFGQQHGMLMDPADATGYKQAYIKSRDPKLDWDPEAQLIATDPVYTEWNAGTTVALVITTSNFTIAAPVMQLQKVGVGDREGHATYDQSWLLARSSGNDEFKISQKTGG